MLSLAVAPREKWADERAPVALMRQTSETHISGTDDGSVLVGDDRHEMPARTSKAVKSGPRGPRAFGQASEASIQVTNGGSGPLMALRLRRDA
jgi:hypothetical protein